MRIFASLFLMAGCALAADGPEGQWTWSMPGPGGADVQADLVMKIEGEKLTGEFAFNGGSRKLEILNGAVKGNEVKFTIKRSRPQGGDMVYELKGVVTGDQMKGSASTDMGNAEWTAKRKS